METRSAKLRVFVTNKRKGLFAVTSIAKDEILINLNGKKTCRHPPEGLCRSVKENMHSEEKRPLVT